MLNENELQEFKNKLERTQADLEKQIKDLEIAPEFGSDIDHGDEEADETEALGTNLGTAEAFKRRLNDVVHALAKIAAGGYGSCENCRKEIDLKLLMVDPESRLCRECKKSQA